MPTQTRDMPTLFTDSPDMLCIATFDTAEFIQVNENWMRLTGFTEAELQAQPFVALVHPDDVQSTYAAAASLSEGKHVVSFVNRYCCKDGSYRWIEWLSISIPSEGLIYAAARDVTERKLFDDALREQEEQVRRLNQTIHELSTPLIPLADQVVLMPLIGHIDSARCQQVMEVLLAAIPEHRARMVLIDITGVPIVDTAIADALLRTAQAARLLGAQVILTGVRPEVAQSLVSLGVDMNPLVIRRSVQDGIQYALKR
jgi:rsbT co-antagonist protein RsbR